MPNIKSISKINYIYIYNLWHEKEVGVLALICTPEKEKEKFLFQDAKEGKPVISYIVSLTASNTGF